MSLWNNQAFTENELSGPAKIIAGAGVVILFGGEGLVATRNAASGVVPHPCWVALHLIGFVLFLVPKLHVVRHRKLVSFGTRLMTPAQANAYRLGYYVMVTGFLLTFG